MQTAAALKKCIVLDLDNTLWGGIVGEDGIEGLALSLTPPGSSFIAFQQALLDHYNRGIILAINSRNNEADALEVIRTHPNMILKEHHFAASRMNWQDKAQNLAELAKELNIGLDSMVFLDDDPTNRALVRATLPEVEVPELPADAGEYARFLNALPHFPKEAATDEDTMRGNLYVTERLRKEAEKSHTTKEDFLMSLGLELTIAKDGSCLPRLAQLTEKTNQFNIDKHPLSEREIEAAIDDPSRHVFYASLTDRFGDYGVILFALVEERGNQWHIAQLLMSCRVFGRGIEDAFFAELMNEALAKNIKDISIAYTETPKNAPAKAFIDNYFLGGTTKVRTKEPPPWVKTN